MKGNEAEPKPCSRVGFRPYGSPSALVDGGPVRFFHGVLRFVAGSCLLRFRIAASSRSASDGSRRVRGGMGVPSSRIRFPHFPFVFSLVHRFVRGSLCSKDPTRAEGWLDATRPQMNGRAFKKCARFIARNASSGLAWVDRWRPGPRVQGRILGATGPAPGVGPARTSRGSA